MGMRKQLSKEGQDKTMAKAKKKDKRKNNDLQNTT